MRLLLDTTVTIDTPERVRFRHRLAGPGPRAAAWVVDSFIQFVAIAILAVVAALVGVVGLGSSGIGLLLLGRFLLDWFYGAFFESLMQGRTPGKLIFNLRVVTESGAPARIPQFVLRNLLKGVDFLPMFYGVGVATMMLDGRLRRIGDLVAGTMVVTEQRTGVLGSVSIDPPVSEEERRALPARVHLDRDELAVIEEFLRRRARLSDERGEELAALYAPSLAERTGIEAPSAVRTLVLAYARATGRDRPDDLRSAP